MALTAVVEKKYQMPKILLLILLDQGWLWTVLKTVSKKKVAL